MDFNTNQEVFSVSLTSSCDFDGGAMKHLQPVFAIMSPPYPY
jgi:hypothetical protein